MSIIENDLSVIATKSEILQQQNLITHTEDLTTNNKLCNQCFLPKFKLYTNNSAIKYDVRIA